MNYVLQINIYLPCVRQSLQSVDVHSSILLCRLCLCYNIWYSCDNKMEGYKRECAKERKRPHSQQAKDQWASVLRFWNLCHQVQQRWLLTRYISYRVQHKARHWHCHLLDTPHLHHPQDQAAIITIAEIITFFWIAKKHRENQKKRWMQL